MQTQVAQLRGANKRLRGVTVGNFEYVTAPLRLGALLGNRFTLVLRNVDPEARSTVADAATALHDSGFINYFGLQRFGSGDAPTHRIGASLTSECSFLTKTHPPGILALMKMLMIVEQELVILGRPDRYLFWPTRW